MTYGYSRDDAGRFLPQYVEQASCPQTPSQRIDEEGVGAARRASACERGRQARPDLKLGICGEHGGDPASIDFFDGAGLDYVSCSPYRVPIARLAAAQSALEAGRGAGEGDKAEGGDDRGGSADPGADRRVGAVRRRGAKDGADSPIRGTLPG